MLRDVSLELARQGCIVSVVARRQHRVHELSKKMAVGRIVPLCVDYHDTDSFIQIIQSSIEKNGPIDLAAVWIHGSAPSAPLELARLLNSQAHPCKYVHVLGSSAANPAASNTDWRSRFKELPYISYQQVILGFILTGGASRWLTNSEIASGVLDAISHEQPAYIVGTVEPWSKRP